MRIDVFAFIAGTRGLVQRIRALDRLARLASVFLFVSAPVAVGAVIYLTHNAPEVTPRATAALASPYRGVASEVGSRAIALLLLLLGIALLFATLVGAPVRGTIDRSSITTMSFADGTTAFVARPSHAPEYIRSDHTGAPDASKLRLFENGRPLGPRTPKPRILNPQGRPFDLPKTGSITPKNPGSFTAKSDTRDVSARARYRQPQGGE